MEKARCNTELYSNLRRPLNNVKPSNFWGSHHLRQALIECGLTVAKRQGFEARLNEAASLNANRLKLVEKAKREYQKVLNLHRSK